MNASKKCMATLVNLSGGDVHFLINAAADVNTQHHQQGVCEVEPIRPTSESHARPKGCCRKLPQRGSSLSFGKVEAISVRSNDLLRQFNSPGATAGKRYDSFSQRHQTSNMADNNLTLMLYKKNELRLEERPIPEPGPGQVQVEMKRVGICGSDVHFWSTGTLCTFVLDGPVALGHEGSAVVTKLGPGVTSLQIGDRVAIEPAVPCRFCRYCKSGRYNLCPHVKGLATPDCDGHLTRYFVHDADFCHKMPENVSFEEGAVIEPLAVAVHVTNRAGVKCGDLVLICGAGPIGLLCMLMCKARGVEAVCLTDVEETRLEFAKTLGADHVINVTNKKPEEVAKEVEEKMGDQVDVSLECSGVPFGVNTAIYATRPGCVVMIVGSGPVMKELPIGDASQRELELRGTFRYVNCFQPAIRLISTGKVDVKPLISHRFKLEEAVQAFELAKSGKGIKVMINCEKEGQAA